jgi:hypothetical protein
MPLHRTRYIISIDSNASPSDRDSFRQELVNGCENHGLGGYFIVDENDSWIHLEGDEDDILEFAKAIKESPMTTGQLFVESDVSIPSISVAGIFAYDRDRAPIVPT